MALVLLRRVVGRPPAHRVEDPGFNPGPDENFFLKLTTLDLPNSYYENKIFKI